MPQSFWSSCAVDGRNGMDRLFRVLALVAVPIALAGCTTDDYRYKLTLTLDTPDGPKTAFNVVAMHVFATLLIATEN